MKLTCYRFRRDTQEIVPASWQRRWMDEVQAYRCIPLAMANATGWEILSPSHFSVSWNGGAAPADLRVESLDGYPDLPELVKSHFGHGILTFYPSYLFTTETGWHLWVRGSPNSPKDGIQPLDAVVESDWLPFRFTMNWAFTRPGRITFEKGEPFCFITPLPLPLVEEVGVDICSLEDNLELHREFRAWEKSRNNFLDGLSQRDPDTLAAGWQKFYLRGHSALGTPACTDHQIKRRLAVPRIMEAQPDQVVQDNSRPHAVRNVVSDEGVRRISLRFHDQTVDLHFPLGLKTEIDALFRHCIDDSSVGRFPILVGENGDNLFSVRSSELNAQNLTEGDFATFLMEAVVHDLVYRMQSAVALHAGAVSDANGNAILIAGGSGVGKSSLTAWLIERGFQYLSDEVVALVNEQDKVVGFPRSLVLKPGAADKVLAFQAFQGARAVQAGSHFAANVAFEKVAPNSSGKCRLIIFPSYVAGSSLYIEALSPAEAGLRLIECNLNARNFPDGGFKAVAGLARRTVALKVQYGDFADLDGVIDVLTRLMLESDLDARAMRQFLGGILHKPQIAVEAPKVKTYPVPIATPRQEAAKKKLTVGMATYDDYDGAYFSLQALRLYHGDLLDEIELLVVDNHPDGPCAAALKDLENSIPNYRYVPYGEQSGTRIRQILFDEAVGDHVLCMDSHVFLVPGALKKLLAYLEANPDSNDLLQGPLVHDDLTKIATHFRPEWRSGMYGVWEADERGLDPEGEPFEIPMQGLGIFACRRKAWPGFNPRFKGFGGEEGYIHEKFRQRGGRTLCLPFLRWLHRFNRPLGIPYANTWDDRIRNYLIGFHELGLDTQEMEEHFRTLLGASAADKILSHMKQEIEERPLSR